MVLPWKSRGTCQSEWRFSLHLSWAVGLQDHAIALCLGFQGPSVLLSIVASRLTSRQDCGRVLFSEVIALCRSSWRRPLWSVWGEPSVFWRRSNSYWCGPLFRVLLFLFYILWEQFTSSIWLLQSWPCLEFFFFDDLPLDILEGGCHWQPSWTCGVMSPFYTPVLRCIYWSEPAKPCPSAFLF